MHRLAMEQRFPDFVDLFYYNKDGYIYDINTTFMWKQYDSNEILHYIINLASSSEKYNINKITDAKFFLRAAEKQKIERIM